MVSTAMIDASFLTGPRPFIPPGPTPLQLDKHFDFLEWSPDGESLLLCTSNLTSRTWAGSVWLYQGDETKTSKGWEPEAKECIVGAGMDCGITSGRFIGDSNTVVVGCDSGALQILTVLPPSSSNIPEAKVKFEGQGSLCEHNDMVVGIDNLGERSRRVVSCSEDKSIKVWDLESLTSTHTFSPAHSRTVTSVSSKLTDCFKKETETFASCAMDGSAVLWDVRNPRPASGLQKASGVSLTSVVWISSTVVVLGGVDGKLIVIDARNTGEPLTTVKLNPRPVHYMSSTHSSSPTVAVCQDSTSTTVVSFTDTNSPQTIYSDDSHGDFVRGLGWHPKTHTLWTCGWDSKVFSHKPYSVSEINGSAN